jgi:hypothetical protein
MAGVRTSAHCLYLVLLLCVWTLVGGFASHAGAQGDQWISNGLREFSHAHDARVTPVARYGDFYWPPRCGPRNCWAMCVTCFYDYCRAIGGGIDDCKAEKEQCKKEMCLALRDCPASNPFCDFR